MGMSCCVLGWEGGWLIELLYALYMGGDGGWVETYRRIHREITPHIRRRAEVQLLFFWVGRWVGGWVGG